MELFREEIEKRKGPNWGKITFERMLRREEDHQSGKTLTLRPKRRLLDALESHLVVSGPLDGSKAVAQLTVDEQCSFFSSYPQCEKLILRDWKEPIADMVLRCISIVMGECLMEIDLSYSNVMAPQLEILLAHVQKLQVLKFSGCPNLDSTATSLLSKYAGDTATELYVDKCPHCKIEALRSIAGCVGFNAGGMKKLKLLDLAECPLEDKGLLALSQGINLLRYLNLQDCRDITDASTIPMVKGNLKLQLLNLSGCVHITNKTARAIAVSCPHLKSINFSRCADVTDVGVKAIAASCPKLQAANLSGLIKVTEGAMCALAEGCPNILMLNLTGCELITTNGLNAMVKGLKYVEAGITFFGFKPMDEHVEKKLMDQMNMLHDAERKRLENERRAHVKAISDARAAEEFERNNAAKCIQGALYRYTHRMYYYHIWRKKQRLLCVVDIQRVWRGYRGRCRSQILQERRRIFLSKSPQAIVMQSLARGYIIRCRDKRVPHAIRNMYEHRYKEAEAAISVRLQAIGRRFITFNRMKIWIQIRKRRIFDEDSALRAMQGQARIFLAVLQLRRLRTNYLQRQALLKISATRVETFYINAVTRYRQKLAGLELQKNRRALIAGTYLLQRVVRGHLGREKVARVKIEEAVRVYAVITIQRVYRGSRVLHWRDLRLNVISAFVLDRQYLERRDRIADSRLRYKQYIEAHRHDSASEDEDEDVELEGSTWTKLQDYKKKQEYWMNMVSGEISYVEPMGTMVKEKSLLQRRVRVFWVAQGEWYTGTVTRFHKRKHRHRVEYDDGDHEWIDMEKELDRVQILMADGSWVMYSMYQSPEMLNEWQKMDRRRETDNFKATAFRDATQWRVIQSDNRSKVILMSELTGAMRAGQYDADDWEIKDDGQGYPCFFNKVTKETAYEDPRFEEGVDEDVEKLREYVMSELRFCSYFCKEFYDLYQEGIHDGDKRALQLVLRRLKHSSKPRQMAAILIRAKALFKPISVVEKPMDPAVKQELEYASWLLSCIAFMDDEARLLAIERAEAKLKVLEDLRALAGTVVYCFWCKRETQRHLDFCPVCGKRQVFF